MQILKLVEANSKEKMKKCDKYLSQCDTFETDLHALEALIYKGLLVFCDKNANFNTY